MLRVDAAGNISKRFAGETFPFSRFGGTCPRWNLHAAFQTPGRVVTQMVETPDGQRFFTIGRTVERSVRLDPREDSQLAIGLGCDVNYARRIVYADGLDLAKPHVTPIGPACAICPRVRCPQRAAAAGRADADRQRDAEDDLALSVPGRLRRARKALGNERHRQCSAI